MIGKTKIRILKIIMLMAIFILLFGCLAYDVSADVGNINRYDTGSFGSDSYSSSSYSSDGDIFWLIYILFDLFGFNGMIIAIIIIMIVWKKRGTNQQKVQRNTTRNNYGQPRQSTVRLPSNSMALDKILSIDENFSETKFLGWSKEIFVKLQNAWTKREWREIRPFESNELFSQHSIQLEEYIRKGQINVIEKINISHARVKEFNVLGPTEVIVVELDVIMRDYVINEKTKEVVEGVQGRDWNMKYDMTFSRCAGVKTQIEEIDNTTNCPNCGAPTRITSSGQCDYCESVITTGNYGWVMTAIKMVR